MAEVILSLGDVAFEAESIPLDELRREKRWRWSEQSPIGGPPGLTYTGPSSQTISLHGVAHPGQLGDHDIIEKLYELADSGAPHSLVDGFGFSYGRWVIESINDDRTPLVAGGMALRIEFEVRLRNYQDQR